MPSNLLHRLLTVALGAGLAIPAAAQEVLPFPPKPSGSIAGRPCRSRFTVRFHP